MRSPIYRNYKLAVRLKNKKTEVINTSADIRTWLPGDIVFEENLYMPEGTYQLEIAIVDPLYYYRVKLAIEGVNDDGWYPMGEIKVLEPTLNKFYHYEGE